MYIRSVRILLWVWLVLAGVSCKKESQEDLSETHLYFKEVALGSETGNSKVIRKWTGDMRILVTGENRPDLQEELTLIVAELNALISPVQIRLVTDPDEANYRIYFGHGSDYARLIEPNTQPYISSNYGFFWVYWQNEEINRGSMYVDVFRTKTMDEQKHLLREELTQSLGLMNDSNKYPESIFYQGWTSTTQYTELDRKIIRLLYHDKLKPGMNASEVDRVIKEIGPV